MSADLYNLYIFYIYIIQPSVQGVALRRYLTHYLLFKCYSHVELKKQNKSTQQFL